MIVSLADECFLVRQVVYLPPVLLRPFLEDI